MRKESAPYRRLLIGSKLGTLRPKSDHNGGIPILGEMNMRLKLPGNKIVQRLGILL